MRFRMSTAWETAWGQKERGALLASRSARTWAKIALMARSATPFRACISGGDSVFATPDSDNSSLNLLDVNSPAPSECNVPNLAISPPECDASRLKEAMNSRMRFGASLRCVRGNANLKRVWSSMRTSRYWKWPVADLRNGPAMSACMRRPGALRRIDRPCASGASRWP